MTHESFIVGRVVADVAISALTSSSSVRRPAVRITGFNEDEILEMVRALESFRMPGTGRPATIKVGITESIADLGPQYCLGPGETLTHWRNADVDALILIDLRVQGDEEGLAAVNRLEDSSVLAEDDESVAAERLKLLIGHAWAASGRGDRRLARLDEGLATVRAAVAGEQQLSLRRWTRFVAAVCTSLAAIELMTPDAVDRAIGEGLSHINLFPDRDLFTEDRGERTRLARNQRVSQGRQPSGSAITDDDLLERIDSVALEPQFLERFALDEVAARERMREIVHNGGPSERCAIDLSVWLALFERRADQDGLGQLVRAHLEKSAPDRLDEFDGLEVEAGLDHTDQEAAERFLRAEPPQDASALVDLLSRGLRRRVEKVAFPDAQQAADPLRALLHGLHVLEDLRGPTVRLGIEGVAVDGDWSQWLFGFLYGRTLRDVMEGTADAARSLEVDPRLLSAQLPALPDEDEDFDATAAWAPLRLTIDVADGGRRRFRWDPQAHPGLVALAALTLVNEPMVGTAVDVDLDAFCERFLDPRHWDDAPTSRPQSTGPVIEELLSIRTEMLSRLQDGLSADLLDEYVTTWSVAMEKARRELVPCNAPLPELADAVLSDVIELNDGHLAMLATHPLRLRWVIQHFRKLTKLLVQCLSDGLELNPENSELFFEWLERAAPHGLPPVIVGADETVAIAAREFGWHEEFTPVRSGGQEQRERTAAVDDVAIDEMVSVITAYLETYPYKQDGLVLLLLDRDGSFRLPLRVIQRLRARASGLHVELHVLAPRAHHHDMVRAFEEAFTEQIADEQLFPAVQLVVRDWDPNKEPDLSGLQDRIDIALAPALFGARTTLNRQTRDQSAALSGGYDPWLHSANHDLADASQNVVRVMLPQQLDPMLETWSTLCVRHDAHSAVAPQQADNTDYFTLQVRFDRHQELFGALHSVAHWVVTLDAYVGRDQVDHLSDRPDVILVRTGVGKNRAYTLIVSSGTGRRFVAQRLEKKLRNDLAFPEDLPLAQVANRFFEVGRNVVPGAVLRALGLGRAVNEVVGLVISRFEVARYFPVPQENPALVAWISFDDHQSWFGRTQRMRADLGRFTLTLDEDGVVRLDVLVVESKFRQTLDFGIARQQLDRTTELCRSAFSGGRPAADTEFWQLELAAAIDQTSRIEQPASELPARRLVGPSRVGLEETVLHSLRSGSVVLDRVRGVAVAIAAKAEDPAPGIDTLQGHALIRVNRPEVIRVVQDLLAGTEPAPASSPLATRETQPFSEDALRPVGPSDEPDSGRVRSLDAAMDERHGGLGETELKGRYERVLDVLRQFSVAVDPPPSQPWREGPGFYILRVIPRAGVSVDKVVNRVHEIELALALPIGAKIRSSLDRGAIAFEIPKTPDERYPVLARSLWDRFPVPHDGLAVPLGEDVSGALISIEFSSPDSPHLLVAGTTGSGKSVALETLLYGLCRYPESALRLHLVDPKGTELLDFADDPHVDGEIGMDASDAVAALEDAVAEMRRRYELMKGARARSLVQFNAAVPAAARLPWRVIVLDEYADLTSDPADKSSVEQLLRRLTQKARAAGIHVIAATQRPSADVVSTTIRSNFPAQLALRVKTATDSRIIMDEPGAETLAGQGDAFLRTARGTTRLQVAWHG